MASLKLNNFPKVFIDGQEMQHVGSLEYSRDTEELGPFVGDTVYRYYSTLAKMRIESAYMTIEAPVEYTEYDSEGNIYVYGPLRKAFPDLFKARELKPWQLAYVQKLPGYKPRQEFKYFSDDDIFTTIEAAWFKKGWKAHEQTSKQH